MIAESSEDRDVLTRAIEKQRQSEVLKRRAWRAAAASRLFLVLSGLGLAAAGVSMLADKPAPPSLEYLLPTEEARARAREVEAMRESGRGMALVTLGLFPVVCSVLAIGLARKWARAASESIASSEVENRRVLEATRSCAAPFALFLRGFEEEAGSIQKLFSLPLSTKRPDKATRWIESEIVDEFKRRGRSVFCVANPSDTFLLPGAIRIEASREDWLSEVGTLANESEVVVVYVSAFSQGLQAELDLLRDRRLLDKSILILKRRTLLRGEAQASGSAMAIVAPSPSILNQSASGPLLGRSRFRRELSMGIEKAFNA